MYSNHNSVLLTSYSQLSTSNYVHKLFNFNMTNFPPMKKLYILFLLIASLQQRAQCTFTSSVPYFEGFSGLTANNQLPQCWLVSNPSTCLTFTTNGGYAAFVSAPTGTNGFITHGIQLYANVVYSISLWHTEDVNGAGNWPTLGILMGTGPSLFGLTPITTSVITTSTVPTAISNTFNVSSSGIYYFAIAAISASTGPSQYLLWDNLTITIPCTIPANTPTVTIAQSSTVYCQGAPNVTLTASGADTYTWTTGATGSVFVPTTVVTSIFSVTGTHTLTNCSSTAIATLAVQPAPVISANVSPPQACSGITRTITAAGASSFTWNGGSGSGPVFTIAPQTSTFVSVSASGTNGCTKASTIQVTVLSSPTVSISVLSPQTICAGESVTLSAQGAASYTWTGPSVFLTGLVLIHQPITSASYSLAGMNGVGCKDSSVVQITVDQCVGITEKADQRVILFPNPSVGLYQLKGPPVSGYSVFDASGRLLKVGNTDPACPAVDLRGLESGIYFISFDARGQRVRVVKAD
jgi:hypothetical protein